MTREGRRLYYAPLSDREPPRGAPSRHPPARDHQPRVRPEVLDLHAPSLPVTLTRAELRERGRLIWLEYRA